MTSSPRATPDQGSAELSDERILEIAHRTATRYTHRSDLKEHSYGFMAHSLLDFARAILAAATQPKPNAEPEVQAWMWQRDEAGHTGFVDAWQVENGWQEANPSCRLIAPLLFAAATQGAPRVDLHAAIMNIPCSVPGGEKHEGGSDGAWVSGYKQGHKAARRAAAELVAAQGAPTPAQAEDREPLITHCPWCRAPVSVADEPYCANADCRWNNGGVGPARALEGQ